MRVLFVSKGNPKGDPKIITYNQGESLRNQGVDVDYFVFVGKGLWSYFKGLMKLKNRIREVKPDIIHAHYSLSGIFTSLCKGKCPMVVSLMGSDIKAGLLMRVIISLFGISLWRSVIVKSEGMRSGVKFRNSVVIPNGVNIDRFYYLNISEARRMVGWEEDRKYIAFIADPDRYEKNFKLAQSACNSLSDEKNIKLKVINNKSHKEINAFLNAASVLLLTSLWEGSPNIIKEAMACNCPIVSTDVGDVRMLFGDTNGCYLTNFSPEDVANKLTRALRFVGRTSGRKRLMELQLSEASVTEKIIEVYKNCLS